MNFVQREGQFDCGGFRERDALSHGADFLRPILTPETGFYAPADNRCVLRLCAIPYWRIL